uniref:NADH-ubiquinone oxidoreductase chain 2 n=1 Tax=Diolcus variegatus TaxID=2080392 RepID=A0A2K9YV16_9HEMI|nr:NADH dehydrogenase subunit 2 [Diolcus variegatus]
MYKSKSLFSLVMMMGTLITLSSNNWISMWMGLEINMMAFIPLIKNKNKSAPQAMMIYLLTQSVSSMILMFSITLNSLMNMELFYNLMLMSLLIKVGAAPFHMWVPEIMTKMSWSPAATLMTWQKIGPLMMINSMSFSNKMMYGTILGSVIVGSVGGLNQLSMRKIMAYSSINHLGWLLSLAKMKNNWIIYLTIYSMMVTMLCYYFNQFNIVHINQINNINMSYTEKMNYLIAMMSLGGLPPFLGFMPKWMVIQTFIQSNLTTMLVVMVSFSLLSLYYYMRSMTNMMMISSSSNKWMTIKSKSSLTTSMMALNMSLPLIMIMNLT